MYTIGQLSQKFHLSRGTLLYYDSIGLLKPSSRTDINYRRYSESDVERLNKICRYRETGMALDDIKRILSSVQKQENFVLEKRLDELNQEIRKLNIQRQIIVCMLKRNKAESIPMIEKRTLVKVLTNSGLDDTGQDRLHAEYEKIAPEEHQAFLELMGISPELIREIREYSKKLIHTP